jgi:hypothetical protein
MADQKGTGEIDSKQEDAINRKLSGYQPCILRHENDGTKTEMTLVERKEFEDVRNIIAERDRLRAERLELLAEIEAWKAASQLEIAGDPDGILPRHLAAYIADQDALCTRLANARHEAARLGYCAGHSDTVNGTYSDPSETAADICQEMDDDERMGENA